MKTATDDFRLILDVTGYHLEYQVLNYLLGMPEARATMLALSRNHYRWVYTTVPRMRNDRKDYPTIRSVAGNVA